MENINSEVLGVKTFGMLIMDSDDVEREVRKELTDFGIEVTDDKVMVELPDDEGIARVLICMADLGKYIGLTLRLNPLMIRSDEGLDILASRVGD